MKVGIVITCKSRLHQLQVSLPRILAQEANFDWRVIVVDYNCPDHTHNWIDSLKDPRVVCVELANAMPFFNVSHARNIGAVHADGCDLLSFIDADSLVEPGWLQATVDAVFGMPYSSELMMPLRASMPGWRHKGVGYITLPAEVFHGVGGYDESMQGWGFEDEDFYNRVRAMFPIAYYRGDLVDVQPHDDELRTRNYEIKRRRRSKHINMRRAAERRGVVNPSGGGRGHVWIHSWEPGVGGCMELRTGKGSLPAN